MSKCNGTYIWSELHIFFQFRNERGSHWPLSCVSSYLACIMHTDVSLLLWILNMDWFVQTEVCLHIWSYHYWMSLTEEGRCSVRCVYTGGQGTVITLIKWVNQIHKQITGIDCITAGDWLVLVWCELDVILAFCVGVVWFCLMWILWNVTLYCIVNFSLSVLFFLFP